MFQINSQFEDTQIIATSLEGDTYATVITDKLTHEAMRFNFTAAQLAMIMAFNLHPDGEPDGFEAYYAELEPLLIGVPVHLRPIP